MGEELHEILQNSSNEEYKEKNNLSEGSNVQVDKEADEIEESAFQGQDDGRNKSLLHVNQSEFFI
jgi:ribosomal protein S8E